jgi:hypothetical protein
MAKRKRRSKATAKAKKVVAKIAAAREEVDLRWVEKNKRIVRIDELMCEPLSHSDVIQKLMTEFEISESTAWRDLRERQARVAELFDEERKGISARAASGWLRRQRLAEVAGDDSAANKAWDGWCRVMGAHHADRPDASSTSSS